MTEDGKEEGKCKRSGRGKNHRMERKRRIKWINNVYKWVCADLKSANANVVNIRGWCGCVGETQWKKMGRGASVALNNEA